TLILNLPPDQSGALPTATVKAMTQLGDLLKQRFGTDLAKTATVVASETRAAGAGRNYDVRNLFDGNTTTYWATNDGTKQATLTFTWDSPQTLRYVDLMELVAKGQRVKKFKLEVTEDGTTWKPTGGNIATTTIGYKRIIPLNGNTEHSYDQGTRAVGLRITIEDAKACPLLKSVAIY
ncbi:MAG: discoidin domain-containing protein, partial [Prevotellaceae bacterium]|nr:discoidin domain-containing protein [Prevotellaceae bacterium]